MCKCNDIDRHALYRKCCPSINGACATPVHVLLDMGADPISFVNGEHDDDDDDDSKTMASRNYYDKQYLWAVSFNSTFFNESRELNDMIKSIKVKVIDSCITVIVDRPVIRSHHLVRKIPSYFDEIESRCQSNQEARPASTPICSLCRSCAHPKCQQSHAKQMGIDVGEDSIYG